MRTKQSHLNVIYTSPPPGGKQRVLDTLGMTQLSELVPGSRLILRLSLLYCWESTVVCRELGGFGDFSSCI